MGIRSSNEARSMRLLPQLAFRMIHQRKAQISDDALMARHRRIRDPQLAVNQLCGNG
jgi:hypothetical protein